jgi:hypothetical protein
MTMSSALSEGRAPVTEGVFLAPEASGA